jgi:nitrogen fixation/metabolism regulation signal transduction histidine kinase
MTAHLTAAATWAGPQQSYDAERRCDLPTEVLEAMHDALLAQSTVGVLVCDADGAIISMNPRMGDLLGAPVPPADIEEWSGLCRTPGREAIQGAHSDNPLALALSGHPVEDALLTTTASDGRTRFLRCTAVPLAGPDGQTLGAVALVAEAVPPVTLVPEDDQLDQVDVERVDHEIRTPLTCSIGHLELLTEWATDLPTEACWSWNALVRGAARLQSAVEALTARRPAPSSPSRSAGPR